MESSSSGEAITKRKRHRKAITKTSNLSERLKPDFDLKDAIVQKAATPKPLEENTVLAVDSLVKSYPQVIHDYLIRILKFVQSDETELCFPNIAPFKEEFLVKIAQNHSLLNVVKFWHEGSLQTAKQILDVLGRNKDVFKLICMNKDERENKNVLVYKKVSVNKSQSKQDKIPTSTLTIESGMKSLSLSESSEMPPGLKITMLNTTLKFIKDPTRLSLEYPEMSLPLAQYMHNLIMPGNKEDGDLGYGFKSIYSVLHETIDRMKDKYDFHFTFKKNTSNKPTTKLVLNKIPKEIEAQSRKIIKSNRNKLKSSISSTSSTESKSLSKSQREYLSKQRVVKKLPSSFLENTLQKFLEFIDDKAQASVEFKNVNVTESRFLESLITISRTEDHFCLFSPECEVMLKRVSRAIRRKDWGLTVNVGKLCRKTETRTIVFFKSPSFDLKTAESKLNISQKADLVNKTSKIASASNITVKNDNRSERNEAKLTDVKNDHNTDRDNYAKSAAENDSVNNALKTTSDLRITVKNRRNDAKVASEINVPATSKNHGKRIPIAFLNAGSLVSKNPSTDHKENETCANITQNGSDVTQVGSNDTQVGSNVTQTGSIVTQIGSNQDKTRVEIPPASRKGRLLKALNTPLESNRAERMMRIMGWEGGALGLRGEGITEPILPALHIAPGAGLGHVRQQPPAILSATESRISFLQSLLSFLKSSASKTDITFAQPMTKRQYNFVKHTMPGFNDRTVIGLNGDKEIDLVDNIVEEMRNDLQLYIDYNISADKKTLHLVKTQGPKFPLKERLKEKKAKKEKRKKAGPKASTTVEVFVNDNNGIDISDTTKDIGTICPTKERKKNKAKPKASTTVEVFANDDNIIDISDTTKDIGTICPTKERKKKKAEPKTSTTVEAVEGFAKDDNVIDISDTIKDIETSCPTLKSAKALAYKIKFLEKIKEFLTDENEFAEYKFDCVIRKKLAGYCENVIKDINRNAATTRFSEIENDLLREIKKNSNGCYMSITFNEKKFRLQKKFGNKQVNPMHNLPPPKSKDMKNTIIYQNNVAIPANRYVNEHNSINDDDHQTKNDKDSCVFKDGYLMVNILPKVNDKDLKIKNNEKDVTKTDETPKDRTNNLKSTLIYQNNVATPADKYINEHNSINDDHQTKHDKDSFVFKDGYLMVNILPQVKGNDLKIDNNEKEVTKTDETPRDKTINDISYESDVLAEEFDTSKEICLDISNDSLMLDVLEEDKQKTDAKNSVTDTEYEKFTHNLNEVNNNREFRDNNFSHIRKECHFEEDQNKSLGQSYRLSDNNEEKPMNSKDIKYVIMVAKDDKPISIDLVKSVQKKISDVIESMDGKELLPFLTCHGVKNGELMYSCHNEYSYYWLKNIEDFFSSELNIIDVFSLNNYKLRMIINSFLNEDVAVTLKRLKMYNPALDIKDWTVINEVKNETFLQSDFFVDEKSFQFISEHGFSLFVGIDKAQFSILWN